jgi:hypothetical protein
MCSKSTHFSAASVDTKQHLLYPVNMARARHPKKDVEKALGEAEERGWTVTPTTSGHRWGVMRCGETSRSGCQVSIWSTPRSPGNHARQIGRAVDRCPHDRSEAEDT